MRLHPRPQGEDWYGERRKEAFSDVLILSINRLEPSGYPLAGGSPRAMTQGYETGSRLATSDLASRQPHELLLMLGAAIGILLSLVLFAIQWSQGIAVSQLSGPTTGVILNVVLGAALWVSATITRKNLMNGAIVAGVVGLILIAFGGQVGLIAGVIGLLGAILAAATPYLPWSRAQHH